MSGISTTMNFFQTPPGHPETDDNLIVLNRRINQRIQSSQEHSGFPKAVRVSVVYDIASKFFREFIEKFYVPLKENNPKFPILIRESSGIQPKVYARYGEWSARFDKRASSSHVRLISSYNLLMIPPSDLC